MTEQSSTNPAGTQTEALGVVDPMRIPGVQVARTWWDGLPPLARVFFVLAVVDVLIRAVGLFGTTLVVDLAHPITVLVAFLPHDALILLPAVIVLRRRDALAATPLITRGAIVVALSELLDEPLRGLVAGNPADPSTGPTVVVIAIVLATAAGWIAMARGFRPMVPPDEDINASGLANLVAGALALNALIALAEILLQPSADLAASDVGATFRIAGAASALAGLALASFGRNVIRGRGDRRRPKQAVDVAIAALVLIAIGSLLVTLVSLVGLALSDLSPVLIGVQLGLSLLAGPVALTAIVVAFGLGLADPSGTIEPVTEDTQPAPPA